MGLTEIGYADLTDVVAGIAKRHAHGRILSSLEGGYNLKALAMSEGLLPYATADAYIYRREAMGNRNEIPIPLKRIIQRKSPDVPLLADDVLYIPDHAGKRAVAKTIQTLTSFGVGTLSGILVWH